MARNELTSCHRYTSRSVTLKSPLAPSASYDTAMLYKKLLTLACAVAIAGIGACFLPPEHVPPPLPPHLAKIHAFAIQVQDASSYDLIDGDAMSQAVASNFNRLWKDSSVRAKPFQPSSRNDATLRITLIRKSASSSDNDPDKPQWTFAWSASAVLNDPDGRLLWQEQNLNSQFFIRVEPGVAPDSWNSRIVMKQAAYSLAMIIGGKILNNIPAR